MLRTVISSLYCTSSDDSMVVQAYVLLDPNKENLYFRQELLPKIETFSKKCSGKINKVFMRCFPISTTPWFSNEGWVRFGRWVLFPSNVAVSIYQDFLSLLLCSNYLLLSMIISTAGALVVVTV